MAADIARVRILPHGLPTESSQLIKRAKEQGKHVMVAGIESGNTASIALHETLGFSVNGRVNEVGMKFGRWRDLTVMQLQLDTRPHP